MYADPALANIHLTVRLSELSYLSELLFIS
jgi:hypothetical protein